MIKVFKIVVFNLCCMALPLLAEDWQLVTPGKTFEFPRDHGSHNEFPLEWWYVTGHLYSDQQEHYGFQFTVFRLGIHAKQPEGSAWHAQSIFIGHQAISDTKNKNFRFCEAVYRGSHEQAFAKESYLHTKTPLQEIRYDESGSMTLRLNCKGQKLVLSLAPKKPIILQGKSGYSQKGEGKGNASYYTSFTRLEGDATLNGLPLQAHAWYDHEVLSASVSNDSARWDWFSIQLEDDTEVMLYRLRTKDGDADPFSSGVLVDSSGNTRVLEHTDFSMKPKRFWTTEDGSVRYPVAWTLELPTEEMKLELEATIDHQELRTEKSTGKRYWEGASRVKGLKQGSTVTGMAFVELVGYAREKE